MADSNSKRLGCLSILLFVGLCLSLLVNFSFFVGRTAPSTAGLSAAALPKFEETVAQPAESGKAGHGSKIALITLRGIISASSPGNLGETMVEDIKMQLRQAAEDAKVKAVVLYVDSPGGEVTASDSIYEAVRQTREKKPVVVYMGSLAASGGYYIACGGSHLIANETTFTGSIGVIMQTLNYRQLLGKVGLEMVTFKSGKFKDLLSGSRELSEEERSYVQALVMQTYDRFVGIVARERKLDEAALRDGVADGRVLSGKDAFEAKLIDGLGEVEAAYAKAMELGGAPGAAVVRYDAPFALGRLFRLFGGPAGQTTAKVEVDIADSLKPRLEAGRLYYLPSILAP
jgi:protease IV